MFVSFYSGNWIHQELVFLSKMSLKAERVSIYKSFIEVDFVAKKRKIVTYNDQVLEIVVVGGGAYSFCRLDLTQDEIEAGVKFLQRLTGK